MLLLAFNVADVTYSQSSDFLIDSVRNNAYISWNFNFILKFFFDQHFFDTYGYLFNGTIGIKVLDQPRFCNEDYIFYPYLIFALLLNTRSLYKVIISLSYSSLSIFIA